MSQAKTRLTLEDALESKDVDLHNSNIENIANALLRITKHRNRLDKLEAKLRELGADPANIDLEELIKAHRETDKLTESV